AAFRPLGGTRGDLGTSRAHFIAAAYRAGGGTIDLERPDRRFWIEEAVGRPLRVFEEIGVVDRRSFDRRRMPKLPYQRPVSLPPRLGRAAANLAELRPGDPVVDPFVGTGALLLEAGLLGARAVRNLARFGVEAERLVVADAAETFSPASGEGWAAVLTDPPYGRASGTDGEPPEELVARVLPRWAKLVRPGGCVTMVCPGGPDPLPEPWVRVLSVPDRVHRSLTRDFRVYRRAGGPG
ncbi:MAG: hypothetical protein L3J91_06940, partial [Thermoplasmata archaeon]|nr:hypothetical protein [Thermoplasmata archaeon]